MAVTLSLIMVVGMLMAASPAYATQPTCGSTISGNTTLTSNLNCSGGNGITVGAGSIKPDCARHTVTGPGTVENCVVKDWGYGVYLSSSSSNTLKTNTATTSNDAFEFSGASSNTFTSNKADSNTADSSTVTMTVSYSIVGGGSPTAPVFHYVLNGASKSLTLTKTAKSVTADAGSVWSVSPFELTGSTSTEHWIIKINQALSGFAVSATTVVFVFYHQFLQKLSYSVVGGGSGYSVPKFSANYFGYNEAEVLFSTPVCVGFPSACAYWFDAGSSWSVTNPLCYICLTSRTEQWITSQATSGTISGTATRAFTYQNQYYLAMDVNSAAYGAVTPASGWHNAGASVAITATAKSGYAFLLWFEIGPGGTDIWVGPQYASRSVPMVAAISETAYFGVSITVTSTPTGSGYVTVNGASVKTPETSVWGIGGKITLAANSPVSCGTGCQYVFTGWSDGGAQSHIITVPGAKTTYTATFQKQYQLTINVSPSGGGTVSVVSGGWYNAGSKVTLTATPNPGWTFKGWKGMGSGSYTGTKNPATITMNAAITETANFS